MKVFRVDSKFCTDNQVQITLNQAPTQLICSKDGYLFYKFDDLTVHRYLTNSERLKMPHCYKPSSDWHAHHLFKFNQPYIFFTPYDTQYVPYNFIEDTYHVRFLYFTKLPNGDAAYTNITRFEVPNKACELMSLDEVKSFLYDISDPSIIGKYIVDWNTGITYAKSKNETLMVDNFIDLSYESILSNYNRIYGEKGKISSIDDVPPHNITPCSLGYHPGLIILSEDSIDVYLFTITFCAKDQFKVEMSFGKVTINENDIITRAQNALYFDSYDKPYLLSLR